MIITSYRVMGDNRVALNGDDGKTYHFVTDETAAAWMSVNATNLPTLASISPTTAVAGAANTTVTLTGTNFHTTYSEVLVNGNVHPRTFVSATSMTIVLPTATVVGAQVWQVSVRNQGVFTTVSKPFTYTAALVEDPQMRVFPIGPIPIARIEPNIDVPGVAVLLEAGPLLALLFERDRLRIEATGDARLNREFIADDIDRRPDGTAAFFIPGVDLDQVIEGRGRVTILSGS